MASAPAGADSRAAFTLLELLAVIALVAILAGIGLGVGQRVVRSGRIAQARAELAVLTAALESYKRAQGDFPRTDDAAQLLQALIGRRSPTNAPTNGRVHLEIARFTLSGSRDPWGDPAVQILDPWGEPYRYAYRTRSPWNNFGFVLYSVGPDGGDFSDLLAGGFPDMSAPANADNIQAPR